MMRIKNLNVLTGTTLSLMLCAVAIAPANAKPLGEPTQNPFLLSQVDPDQAQQGKIRSIVGNLVDVELENGDDKTFWVSKGDQGRLNLIEGTDVYVVDDQIVGVVRPGDMLDDTSIATNRSDAVFEELNRRLSGQRAETTIPRPAPPTTTVQQPERTFEPAPAPQPVRALW